MQLDGNKNRKLFFNVQTVIKYGNVNFMVHYNPETIKPLLIFHNIVTRNIVG